MKLNPSLAAKFFISLMTVVWCLAALFSLLMIVVSPMMFDAPGSEKNPVVIAAFWALVTFPFVVTGAIAGAFCLVEYLRRPVAGVLAILLPAINVAIFFRW